MFRYVGVVLWMSISLAAATTAEQTDWSGGPAVPGPVGQFMSTFSTGVNTDWTRPGEIRLGTGTVAYLVDGAFNGAISVSPADLDGDGDVDIAGAALDGNEIAWWENLDGLGSTWRRHTVTTDFTGASSVSAGDFDGDGDPDLLGAGKTLYGGHDIIWWENADGLGTTWTEHAISSEFAGAHAAYPADMDGDGDLDAVGAAIYRDELAWWENRDTLGIVWVKHLIVDTFDGAWTASPGDMDGDGDQDVVGGAYYADDVSWFENTDGAGTTWVKHNVDTGFDGAYFVRTFDLDADGDLDILGAAALADDVTWWENRAGTFMGHVIDGECDGAVCVYGSDLDGDGDGDVLAASINGDAVHQYTREGTGWTASVLAMSFDGAMAVSAADLDGDGSADAMGVAMLQDAVSWWDGSPSAGFLESSILDTRTDPVWGLLNWTAVTPEGTSVAFQVRASDNSADMGDWSAVIPAPGRLSDVLTDGDSFLQYRALLSTSKPGTVPVLESVEMTWIPVAIGESGAPVPPGTFLYPVSPNPAGGTPPLIRFNLAADASVRVSVFDITGRIVWEEDGTGLAAGFHQLTTEGLRPGVYLCRMVSDGFEAGERFTVVE
jgi:hypothetical protein